MEGSFGDGRVVSPDGVSNPSPSSSHQNGGHVYKYTKDSSEVFGVECGELAKIPHCHSPALCSIEEGLQHAILVES